MLLNWMYKNNITYDSGMFGTWTDQQIPNTYSHYADPCNGDFTWLKYYQ